VTKDWAQSLDKPIADPAPATRSGAPDRVADRAAGGGDTPPGTDMEDEPLIGGAINEPDAVPREAATGAGGPVPSREALVRAAAYRRHVARGGGHGSDVEDWLAAEAEIDAMAKRSASP